MPIVHIDLLAGRSPEMKAALLRRVTEAVTESLGVQRAQVRVLITEYLPEHWGVGGEAIVAPEIASAAEGSDA